ncbi:MAG: DUF3352 domain-containing protein [Anaerolineae bacterium]|nr:DUF3352 domain-containing protein [Anaerolineae bacterium]
MYCTECGAPNDSSARFCVQCGAPLTSAVPAPPAPRPAVEPRRPRRWLGCVAIAGLASLLVVMLCGAVLLGVYFFLGFNHTNQTARMVPADTPILLSFSPDPRQALHLRTAEDAQAALAVFGAVPEVRDAAEQLEEGLAQDFDIEWERDVMSWIGPEAGLAIMDTESTSSGVPPMILTAATRNQAKSDAFLLKVRQALEDEGMEFTTEEYKSVQIVYAEPEYEGAFAPAFATVKGLVVIGSDLGAVHQAIDTGGTRGAAKLADQEMYKRVMDQLPANRLGYFYLSSETFLGELQDLQDMEIPLGLGSPQAMAMSFSLGGDGVRLDYVVSADPESLNAAQLQAAKAPTNRRQTAALLPDETVAYLSGQGIATNWETTYGSSEELQGLQEMLDQVKEETGIDLVDDVIARLTGEFAIAILPDSIGLLGDQAVPLGLLVVIRVEQPEQLKASLDKLIKASEEEGWILDQEQIDGTTFTLAQDPYGDMTIGYGLKGDLLIIGSSRDMLQAAIKGQDRPLSDDKTFRAAIKPLPDRAASYLFIDVEKAVRLVYETMDPEEKADFDEDVRPYLEPFLAISMGAEPTDKEGMSRGTLFLYIRQD